MTLHPGHFVAVFGGACSGSEAAHQLAQRGLYVAVFEQQPLPYGKIEDGLPKWHVKLRDKEEGKIDSKLNHPNVFFVPNTRLGEHLDFDEVVNRWGFSAVVLASGAWRDRPLPVDGVDAYLEKGFYYQNPFVDWFNHHHEPGYNRNNYAAQDGAIVVGGGLASIDVVKILMLETTAVALQERGHKVNVLELEHQGISKVLEELGISMPELGLSGCTLYYRRRSIDMPLSSMPDDADEAKIARTQQVRQKILDLARSKYLFRFEECCKPVGLLEQGERLNGLVFRRTEMLDGRLKDIPGSEFSVVAPLVISSIGSIPEPIRGIPSEGELFVVPDTETGRLQGFRHVFAVGNAVTGKGNIRESELHSRRVITRMMDEFLNWGETDRDSAAAGTTIPGSRSVEELSAITAKIRQRQQAVGYTGDYSAWVNQHRPQRLEDM